MKKETTTIKKTTKTTKATKAVKIKKTEIKKEKVVSAKAKKVSTKTIFTGKYIQSIGRRKTAVAQVRLYKKGKGRIIVNGVELDKYLTENGLIIATQALKLTSHLDDLDFSIIAKGGGKDGQAGAIRLGITRTLIIFDKDLEAVLKSKGFTTRDARRKERKKPGLKKARKAPQWSKR